MSQAGLFLQGANLGGQWAQNAQQQQFAQQDRAALEQEREFRRHQYREKIRLEGLTRQADTAIANALMSSSTPQQGQPQGDQLLGRLQTDDLRTKLGPEVFQYASDGWLHEMAKHGFDSKRTAESVNGLIGQFEYAAKSGKSQYAKDVAARLQAMNIPVPTDKLPRAMRDAIEIEDYQDKAFFASDMGLQEGTPEYQRLMQFPKDIVKQQWEQVDTGRQVDALAQAGIAAGLTSPEEAMSWKSGGLKPADVQNELSKRKATREANQLKLTTDADKAAKDKAADEAAVAAAPSVGLKPEAVQGALAMRNAGLPITPKLPGDPNELTLAKAKQRKSLAEDQIRQVLQDAERSKPQAPNKDQFGDGKGSPDDRYTGTDRMMKDAKYSVALNDYAVKMQEHNAKVQAAIQPLQQELQAAQEMERSAIGVGSALTGGIDPAKALQDFVARNGRNPTREEWAAMKPASMQSPPR